MYSLERVIKLNVTIDKAVEKDIDEVEQLYNQLNDFLANTINYPSWKKGVYPSRREVVNGILEETMFVVKNTEETIIGSVILNHYQEAGYRNVDWHKEYADSEIIVIHTLAVHPNYLKCGVGQILIEFTIKYAKQNKIKSIRLDVCENNIPAIKLYEKNQFKYVDTLDLGYGGYGLNYFKLYEYIL